MLSSGHSLGAVLSDRFGGRLGAASGEDFDELLDVRAFQVGGFGNCGRSPLLDRCVEDVVEDCVPNTAAECPHRDDQSHSGADEVVRTAQKKLD